MHKDPLVVLKTFLKRSNLSQCSARLSTTFVSQKGQLSDVILRPKSQC